MLRDIIFFKLCESCADITMAISMLARVHSLTHHARILRRQTQIKLYRSNMLEEGSGCSTISESDE